MSPLTFHRNDALCALPTRCRYVRHTQWCRFLRQELRETCRRERAITRGGATKKARFSRTSCPRNLHHWVFPPWNMISEFFSSLKVSSQLSERGSLHIWLLCHVIIPATNEPSTDMMTFTFFIFYTYISYIWSANTCRQWNKEWDLGMIIQQILT